MSKYIVCGTSGSLHFQDTASHERYKYKSELLLIETYAEIRDEYGIWCGNQNKFVATREEMKEWDSKFMEDLYDKYYPEGE